MFRLQVHRQDRRVNLRRGKVRVAQHPLDQLHVGPAAQHVRGEGVAQDVALHRRAGRDGPDAPPHHPPDRAARDPPPAGLHEQRPLSPLGRGPPGRIGREPGGPRRHHPPRAHHRGPDLADVAGQELQGFTDERQRPALVAFPVPHRQRPLGQAHVVQVQGDELRPADAGGIENLKDRAVPHPPVRPDVGPRQDVLHLGFRRDVRRKRGPRPRPFQMRRRVHRHFSPPRQELEELPRRHQMPLHRQTSQPPPAPPAIPLHHPRLVPVHHLPRHLPHVLDGLAFQELDQRPQFDLPPPHRPGRVALGLQPPQEGVPRLDQFHCGTPSGRPPLAAARSLGWQRFNSRFRSLTSTRK